MGRLVGRVAVVSGAARGQGRSHAVALAREGADVVAFDVCEPLIHPSYPGATWEDLEQTRRLVEAEGRSCLTAKLDARDLAGLRPLAEEACDRLEHIDVLVINHGIWVVAPNSWDLEESSWQESIDVLLTRAWKVAATFIPTILESGGGWIDRHHLLGHGFERAAGLGGVHEREARRPRPHADARLGTRPASSPGQCRQSWLCCYDHDTGRRHG